MAAGLKRHVQDLSVIEMEVLGITESRVEQLRRLPFIDTVSVEPYEQKQMLSIHSNTGSSAVQQILNILEGLRVDKVTVREPTLEDAYVRLVGGEV